MTTEESNGNNSGEIDKPSISQLKEDIKSVRYLLSQPLPHHWVETRHIFAHTLSVLGSVLEALGDQLEDNEGGIVQHVTGCIHCGKDHDVRFHQFKANGAVGIDAYEYKYWGMCPTNNEPIFMKKSEAG